MNYTPSDEDAPEENDPWDSPSALTVPPQSSSQGLSVHMDRLATVDACREKLSGITDAQQCVESYERIIVFAYDAGRSFACLEMEQAAQQENVEEFYVERPA
jgi:hypothetical protein